MDTLTLQREYITGVMTDTSFLVLVCKEPAKKMFSFELAKTEKTQTVGLLRRTETKL